MSRTGRPSDALWRSGQLQMEIIHKNKSLGASLSDRQAWLDEQKNNIVNIHSDCRSFAQAPEAVG